MARTTPVRPQHRRRSAPAAKLCRRRSKRHRPERRRRQCRLRHHAAALPPPTCAPRLPRRWQSRRSNCHALCEWGVPAPRVIECPKPQPAGSSSSPSVRRNPLQASPPVRRSPSVGRNVVLASLQASDAGPWRSTTSRTRPVLVQSQLPRYRDKDEGNKAREASKALRCAPGVAPGGARLADVPEKGAPAAAGTDAEAPPAAAE